MIKRNKQNLRKIVRIEIPESAKPTAWGKTLNGRIGMVVGFRGDAARGIPYVTVLIKNLNNDKWGGGVPIPGKYLIPIKEGKKNG
jgi:ribosomal protein L21E